jgi:hypothetical protein
MHISDTEDEDDEQPRPGSPSASKRARIDSDIEEIAALGETPGLKPPPKRTKSSPSPNEAGKKEPKKTPQEKLGE